MRDRLAAVALGRDAEDAVVQALRVDGWSVLATNWHGGGHELDVIASRGDALRFVEVKSRGDGADDGLDAVDDDKVRRLVHAAEAWLADQTPEWSDMGFLVALVHPDAGGFVIQWVDDAFDATS